jgi:hypothetical protein
MSTLGFYVEVVRALEEIEAPYMIVGAFAASAYGLTRSTHDIDILVDLRWQDCDALAARFPPPRYYADPEQMRNSMQSGIIFNIIDTAQHPSDIRTVLVFMLSGLAGEPLDIDYVTQRAVRIGPEATALWQQLLDQARADMDTRPSG